MTVHDFINLKDIRIKNSDHLRIVELFYPYLSSVSGDTAKLPRLLGNIINIDLNQSRVITGCFNGVNDDTIPPYDDVDLYVKLDCGIKVFVYGRKKGESAVLGNDEYVVFCTSDTLSVPVNRKGNNHIYL